jgi:SAM-dependent methyltransferase
MEQYFSSESPFWRDIYDGADVYSLIHQRRLEIVLSWVDSLRLPAGSDVLEVGCGAGLTATRLAQRGLAVQATDAVPAMVELARERVLAAGVADRVRVDRADAHSLEASDAAVDMVVALGVIPWLRSPPAALHEFARVLRPGGVLIANCDNAARLDHRLDPIWNPSLAPLRSAGGRMVPAWRPASDGARARTHSIVEFDRLLRSCGFQVERGLTFGFGPFTLLNRAALPERLGVRLHHRLQRAADRGVAGIRAAGAQYIVLARRR